MENNIINIISEEEKPKIFNSIYVNKTEKKKYFRVEKAKRNSFIINNQNLNGNNNNNNDNLFSLNSIKKDSKKIFSTQKEYSLLKRKTLRDNNLKQQDLLVKNNKNKFFYTTKNENTEVDQSNNINTQNSDFFVQKIIPTKIKFQNNDTYNLFHRLLYNKENGINSKNMDISEDKEEAKNDENDNIKCYKIKLMLVYLYSIKNLCKYINQNFFNANNQNLILDGYYYQIYQSLQILDKKINDFKLFQNLKDKLQIKKEEYQDIFSLKDNLLSMKNALSNNMAQNLLNIYVDIDNFCHDYSL